LLSEGRDSIVFGEYLREFNLRLRPIVARNLLSYFCEHWRLESLPNILLFRTIDGLKSAQQQVSMSFRLPEEEADAEQGRRGDR